MGCWSRSRPRRWAMESLYTFHAPLHRGACEALGRACAARLGRRFGRNLTLTVADLGWSIHSAGRRRRRARARGDSSVCWTARVSATTCSRGSTAAICWRGGSGTSPRRPSWSCATPSRAAACGSAACNWASTRLYPLVQDACPDHPVLRETRREVLEDLLDVPAALRWIDERPTVRCRVLDGLSPFAAAWIEPGQGESLQFEPAAVALAAAARAAGSRSDGGRGMTGPDEETGDVSIRRLAADARWGGNSCRRTDRGDRRPAPGLRVGSRRRRRLRRRAFARRNQERLARVLGRAAISRLVVAGDLIESPRDCPRTTADVQELVRLARGPGRIGLDSGGQPRPAGRSADPGGAGWSGPPARDLHVAGWTIAHGHKPLAGRRTISGHHHPVFRHDGLAALCFMVGGGRIVLPAFSANAAGCDVASAAVPRSWRTANLRCIVSTGDELLDFGPINELRRRLARSAH